MRVRIGQWDAVHSLVASKLSDIDLDEYLESIGDEPAQMSDRYNDIFASLEELSTVLRKAGLEQDISTKQFSFKDLYYVQGQLHEHLFDLEEFWFDTIRPLREDPDIKHSLRAALHKFFAAAGSERAMLYREAVRIYWEKKGTTLKKQTKVTWISCLNDANARRRIYGEQEFDRKFQEIDLTSPQFMYQLEAGNFLCGTAPHLWSKSNEKNSVTWSAPRVSPESNEKISMIRVKLRPLAGH